MSILTLKLKLRRLIDMWGKVSVLMYFVMAHPMCGGMYDSKIGAFVIGALLALPLAMGIQCVRWIYTDSEQ